MWWPTHYDPPQPGIRQCLCGAWVITQVWVHGTREQGPYWRQLREPMTPCFGYAHVCREEVEPHADDVPSPRNDAPRRTVPGASIRNQSPS